MSYAVIRKRRTVVVFVSEETNGRAKNGQFVKGNGAAIGHGPRGKARQAFETAAPGAIKFLVAVFKDDAKHLPDNYKNTPELMVKAAITVIEQAFGKPSQRTEVTGAEGQPIRIDAEINDARSILLDRVNSIAARIGAEGSDSGPDSESG